MTEPMTAAEARKIADSFPGNWHHYETTRIRVGLRAYADMLERQTVDREAVKDVLKHVLEEWRSALWDENRVLIDQATDAILAAIEAERPAIEAAERERLGVTMRIPQGIDPQSFIYGQMNAYAQESNRRERRAIVDETEAAIRADERERLAKLADKKALTEARITDGASTVWFTVAQFIRSQN